LWLHQITFATLTKKPYTLAYFNGTQVITSLSADDFGKWQEKNFAPESDFLEMLKAIDGISAIETQTYTVSLFEDITFPFVLEYVVKICSSSIFSYPLFSIRIFSSLLILERLCLSKPHTQTLLRS
jgi:hypothetical protein